MKTIFLMTFLIITLVNSAQDKNFIDQPYLETSASVDTLVTPDKIFLSFIISESDSKDKISVEELEKRMAEKLKSLGIVLEKQLTLNDLSSNFKKYFLKQKDVLKSKAYTLEVFDANTAGKVIMGLEQIGISNVELVKTEYSKMDEVQLALRTKAVLKAKSQGEAMIRPLNQKLGMAIHIHDLTAGPIARSNEMGGRIQMAYATKVADDFEPLGIDFEKITVQSNVFVKFKIE